MDLNQRAKPQALQSSQAEPLPVAKSATSNFVTKPIPTDKVTIFIGSNPSKEGTVLFDGQARVKGRHKWEVRIISRSYW